MRTDTDKVERIEGRKVLATASGTKGAREPHAGVSEDQIYLLERINQGAKRSKLSIALVQKLNVKYSTGQVSDALRYIHGFAEVYAPTPYLIGVLKSREVA